MIKFSSITALASAWSIANDKIQFDALYDAQADELVITTVQPDDSWFGILLGSDRMAADADCIVFTAQSSSSRAVDHYLVGREKPLADPVNDVTSVVKSTANGKVTMETRRKLDTGDRGDYVIPLGSAFTVAYAYGLDSAEISYHGTKKGAMVLTLAQAEEDEGVKQVAIE